MLEDLPNIATDLSLRLEQLEYVVLRRIAGSSVMSEVVKLEPDVILLVIRTPRTNAHRLTTEFRKNLSLQRTLLVAVAHSRKEIERGWPKGDFDHRVVWPEDESILWSIIGEGNGVRNAVTHHARYGRMTRNVRLLLVEDNAILAEATAEYLKLWGLDVLMAGNGKDALQAAGMFRPNIVLCDLSLPDMSGLDLLQALRLNSDTERAVLALHSAMSDVDLRLIAREANIQLNLCLTKPLTKEKIQRLLDELDSSTASPDSMKRI